MFMFGEKISDCIFLKKFTKKIIQNSKIFQSVKGNFEPGWSKVTRTGQT